MALIIRKSPNGRLEAKNDNNPIILLLNKTRRVANFRSFEVMHYLLPETGMVVYALKGLSMSMLHKASSCTANQFGLSDRHRGSPFPVYYEGVVFMVFPNIQRSTKCLLIGPDQRVLAGSNIFDANPQPGILCLGTAIDPLRMSPVDALCFNEANGDLQWQGQALTGAWEDLEPANRRSRKKIFKIHTWPSWTTLATPIPQILIDACVA